MRFRIRPRQIHLWVDDDDDDAIKFSRQRINHKSLYIIVEVLRESSRMWTNSRKNFSRLLCVLVETAKYIVNEFYWLRENKIQKKTSLLVYKKNTRFYISFSEHADSELDIDLREIEREYWM